MENGGQFDVITLSKKKKQLTSGKNAKPRATEKQERKGPGSLA